MILAYRLEALYRSIGFLKVKFVIPFHAESRNFGYFGSFSLILCKLLIKSWFFDPPTLQKVFFRFCDLFLLFSSCYESNGYGHI